MEETLSEIDSLREIAFAKAPTSSLGVIGANFKTTRIETREKLAKKITAENVAKLVREDATLANCEIVVLSTCNRTEIYYYAEEDSVVNCLKKLFAESDADVYHLRAEQAATHLFSVAAGLDSLVVGEAQILSQVNDASKQSAEHGISGEVMSRLFTKAFETARNVRDCNPAFAKRTNNSVSDAVLELVTKQYSNKKPNVLLIGSGKMIRLAISSIERSKLGMVVVAARKKEIDGIKSGIVVNLTDIPRTIAESEIDVVITATSAQDYVVRAIDLQDIGRELMILDISVPRNVDPNVGKIRNVTLLNLDDLKDRIGTQHDTFPKVGKELSRGVSEFSSWLADYEEIAPLLAKLRKKAETIRGEELSNALSRMPNLTDDQKAIIEKMSERLIRRFLHEPTTKLKHLSRTEGNQKAKAYAEVISELFSSDSQNRAGNE